jgi:hypothetical protein
VKRVNTDVNAESGMGGWKELRAHWHDPKINCIIAVDMISGSLVSYKMIDDSILSIFALHTLKQLR